MWFACSCTSIDSCSFVSTWDLVSYKYTVLLWSILDQTQPLAWSLWSYPWSPRNLGCKSKPGSIHSQRHLQKVSYPQIRRWVMFWKCKSSALHRINCPLRATESHYSSKLKCNIQSLPSDEVTFICRVTLPTDLRSLIHLTQFTPISSSLQLSQCLTFSELRYCLSSAWGPCARHS